MLGSHSNPVSQVETSPYETTMLDFSFQKSYEPTWIPQSTNVLFAVILFHLNLGSLSMSSTYQEILAPSTDQIEILNIFLKFFI